MIARPFCVRTVVVLVRGKTTEERVSQLPCFGMQDSAYLWQTTSTFHNANRAQRKQWDPVPDRCHDAPGGCRP